MKLRQRLLHLQVHPLKLVTEWVSAMAAAALLWQHALAYGAVVAALPPLVRGKGFQQRQTSVKHSNARRAAHLVMALGACYAQAQTT